MRHDAEFIAIIAAILISGTTASLAEGIEKAVKLIAAAKAAAPKEEDVD